MTALLKQARQAGPVAPHRADDRPRPSPPYRARRPGEQGKGVRVVALALAGAVQLSVAFALLHQARVAAPPEAKPLQVVLVETPEKPPDPPPPLPQPQLPQTHVVLPSPPVIQIEAPKPPPIAPSPSAITMPTPAPPPPPPPQAQAPGIEDKFKAAVRAAVFAAHHVPDSARLLALYGETRVGFTLLDGAVGDIRMIAGSGHEALDQAALAAVRNARYPETPETLRGQKLTFEITLYHRRGEN